MQPVSSREFARLIAPLGPFEPRPHLAVAVSGGPDSMALALLAAGWARAARGRVTVLTVDHGLRRESAAEARQVARWLRARSIAYRTLRWRGPKPDANLAAKARAARYRLLTGWCRANGVLHLLVAHQLEDQAETVLLRLARGSGIVGLAGMAPVAELADVRLLRPLLDVPRDRLRATLEAAGQAWVEDPTNLDTAYARVRARNALAEATGVSPRAIADTAARLRRSRAALERSRARFLARHAWIHPAGFARLDAAALQTVPLEIALRSLATLLRCIGGADYPPRFERLERLYREIVAGTMPKSRTLGGCLIVRERAGLIVAREPAAHADSLGLDGWQQIVTRMPDLRAHPIPMAARPSLPAVRRGRRIDAVPHLGYGPRTGPRVPFAPPSPLAGATTACP
jgi:tRNA(Ile)-lysidine synthase